MSKTKPKTEPKETTPEPNYIDTEKIKVTDKNTGETKEVLPEMPKYIRDGVKKIPIGEQLQKGMYLDPQDHPIVNRIRNGHVKKLVKKSATE